MKSTIAAAELLNETPEQRLEHEVLEWTESVYDEAERELSDSEENQTHRQTHRLHRGPPVESASAIWPVSPGREPLRSPVYRDGGAVDRHPASSKSHSMVITEGFSELESLLNQYISLWAENTDFEGDLSQTVIYGLLGTPAMGKSGGSIALANG